MKLVHLVGFIIKKFVTMHGYMNVKNFHHFLVFIILICATGPLLDESVEKTCHPQE